MGWSKTSSAISAISTMWTVRLTDLDVDAVADHQADEAGAVDENDTRGDRVGMGLRVGDEAAGGDEDALNVGQASRPYSSALRLSERPQVVSEALDVARAVPTK